MNRVLRNPLACSGTSVPPNALLAAKLAFLLLLADRFFLQLRAPLAPLFPLLEQWHPWPGHGFALLGVFFAAGACLLVNFGVRCAAFMLGAVVLFTAASALPAFRPHVVLCGCIILLASLEPRDGRARLIPAQVVLTYAAAFFGHALNPAWRSGEVVSGWLSEGAVTGLLRSLDLRFGGGMLPDVLTWGIPAGELVLAIGLAMPRLRYSAVWLGILFHVALDCALPWRPIGWYSLAVGVGYLSFLQWPRAELQALWPRACGWPLWLRIAFDRYDFDHRIEWPFPQDPDAGLQLERDGRHFFHWGAMCGMLLYFPAFHFAVFALLVLPLALLPETAAIIVQLIIFVPLLAFFTIPGVRFFHHGMRDRIQPSAATNPR